MDGPNFAEIQRKHDEGDLTEEEAYKCGQTHAAYDWAPKTPPNWKPELRKAYRAGHDAYKKTHNKP